MKRIGLDTNFLACLVGVNKGASDAGKTARARDLLMRLGNSVTYVVSTQALGELFVVMTRSGATRSEAQSIVDKLSQQIERIGTSPDILDQAIILAVSHHMQMWDAIILAASLSAGCYLLLSEDMQDGFQIGTMTLINPFTTPLANKLADLIAHSKP
jgi:predicted nucleic acid-binding protein